MKWLRITLLVVAGAVALVSVVLARHWPFGQKAVSASLADLVGGQVHINRFRKTFFPAPGCIAEGVTIANGSDVHAQPVVRADRLVLKSSYGALLRFSKSVDEVRVSGLHIWIPHAGQPQAKGTQSLQSTSINRLVAESSDIAFEPQDPQKEPFRLGLHRVELTNLKAASPIGFVSSLHVPAPPGEVHVNGRFGPFLPEKPFQTLVSGTYKFTNANLAILEGILGTLSSSGQFQGTLAQIAVHGDSVVPDFEVQSSSHRVPLKTEFRAMVNGQTGDVRIENADAHLLRTLVRTEGQVTGRKPGDDKTITLEMAVHNGRIQDLLRLVNSGPPDLFGMVDLRFKVRLPPGKGRFLERLELNGDMGVGNAKFRNSETQQSLERISRHASDGEEDPAAVVSQLRGNITVTHGVATLRGLTFHTPGAWAEMNGTYHLLTHRLDLRGTVHLDEKLSKTTSGVKSFLLKAIDPFFKKGKHRSVVPIRITGVHGHTSVELNL
jgi:AsmA-like C-terminal region